MMRLGLGWRGIIGRRSRVESRSDVEGEMGGGDDGGLRYRHRSLNGESFPPFSRAHI